MSGMFTNKLRAERLNVWPIESAAYLSLKIFPYYFCAVRIFRRDQIIFLGMVNHHIVFVNHHIVSKNSRISNTNEFSKVHNALKNALQKFSSKFPNLRAKLLNTTKTNCHDDGKKET